MIAPPVDCSVVKPMWFVAWRRRPTLAAIRLPHSDSEIRGICMHSSGQRNGVIQGLWENLAVCNDFVDGIRHPATSALAQAAAPMNPALLPSAANAIRVLSAGI